MDVPLIHQHSHPDHDIFEDAHAVRLFEIVRGQFLPQIRVTELEDDVGVEVTHTVIEHIDSVGRVAIGGDRNLGFQGLH